MFSRLPSDGGARMYSRRSGRRGRPGCCRISACERATEKPVSTAAEQMLRDQMVALLPRLRRFALMLTGSRADADDLVQATCERAILRRDGWLVGSALDRWLFKIAHNLYRNQRRDHANRLRLVQAHGETQPWATDGTGHAKSGAMLRELRERILTLPEEQRTVLTLVAVEGLSYQEAGDLLAAPTGPVPRRLGRRTGGGSRAAAGGLPAGNSRRHKAGGGDRRRVRVRPQTEPVPVARGAAGRSFGADGRAGGDRRGNAGQSAG